MTDESFSNELARALARPDADKLRRQIEAYHKHTSAHGWGAEWPDEISDDIEEVLYSGLDHPDKALAYVIIAAANIDDPGFLGFMGASALEDSLHDPSSEFLNRVVNEAQKTPRFRWLLSCPYPHAIADRAWEAIKEFVVEDVDNTPLPPPPTA